VNTRPLGIGSGQCTLMVAGDDASSAVSRGCVRKIKDGETTLIAEMVSCEHGESFTWELLVQEGAPFMLQGRGERRRPRTSVLLADLPLGTSVQLIYDCESVTGHGCLGWCDHTDGLQEALEGIDDVWLRDMLGRSYARLTPPPVELGGGFSVTFDVPFKREDVFRESAMALQPLGTDDPDDVTYALVGSHPHPAEPEKLAVGMRRKVEFLFANGKKGAITSEVTHLMDNSFIKWRQLESTCEHINFLGTDDRHPEMSIAMMDNPHGGTTVLLTYDFEHLEVRGCASFCLPVCHGPAITQQRLVETIRSVCPTRWTGSMERRNYRKLYTAIQSKATRASASARTSSLPVPVSLPAPDIPQGDGVWPASAPAADYDA